MAEDYSELCAEARRHRDDLRNGSTRTAFISGCLGDCAAAIEALQAEVERYEAALIAAEKEGAVSSVLARYRAIRRAALKEPDHA